MTPPSVPVCSACHAPLDDEHNLRSGAVCPTLEPPPSEPVPDVLWEVVGEGDECPVCSHDASEHAEPVGCLVDDGECECPLAPAVRPIASADESQS